jgi:hypothetical protein
MIQWLEYPRREGKLDVPAQATVRLQRLEATDHLEVSATTYP